MHVPLRDRPARGIGSNLPIGRNTLDRLIELIDGVVSGSPTTFRSAPIRHLVRGLLEPGALYVLREGFGVASLGHRFVYVSDGGHWENLGLVELLRQRCTDILLVDATRNDNLSDLGRAIQIARSELGVVVEIDADALKLGPDGLARSDLAFGQATYPDGMRASLTVARKVLTESSPQHLLWLRDRDSRFPNHPTSDQFLSDELFEGYRSLGRWVGARATDRISFRPIDP